MIRKIIAITMLVCAVMANAAADDGAAGVMEDSGAVKRRSRFFYSGETAGGKKNQLLFRLRDSFFSVRPEFSVVLGEVSRAGMTAEYGMVYEDGLYQTGEFSLGGNYAGAVMNIGYCFDLPAADKAAIKGVAGGSAGFNYGMWNIRFVSSAGELLGRDWGAAVSAIGVFGKILCRVGESDQIDLTAKMQFGYKANSVRYDEKRNEIIKKDGFGAICYIGIGYAITGERGKK